MPDLINQETCEKMLPWLLGSELSLGQKSKILKLFTSSKIGISKIADLLTERQMQKVLLEIISDTEKGRELLETLSQTREGCALVLKMLSMNPLVMDKINYDMLGDQGSFPEAKQSKPMVMQTLINHDIGRKVLLKIFQENLFIFKCFIEDFCVFISLIEYPSVMEEQNDSRDCNIQDLKNHIEIFLAVFGHDLTAFDRLISSNRQLIAGHVDIGMMILDRLCKHVIGRDILRATFIKKPELLVDLNIGYFVGLLPILSATLESYKLLEKIIISKPHILEAIPIEPFIALLNSNRRVAMVCILVKCHEGICLLQRIFSSRPQLLLSPELTNHPVFLILINILIEQKNFNFLFIILTANHHHILKLFLYSISGQKILKSISSLSPTEANIGLLNLVEHAKKAPIQARTPIRYNALNTRAKTSDCTPSLTYIPLMIDKEGSPLPCDYSPPVHHHSPGLRS